jgi:hypothetical protein
MLPLVATLALGMALFSTSTSGALGAASAGSAGAAGVAEDLVVAQNVTSGPIDEPKFLKSGPFTTVDTTAKLLVPSAACGAGGGCELHLELTSPAGAGVARSVPM